MGDHKSGFTQKQVYKLIDYRLSDPVPLHEADLTKPFIYDRKWGVFTAPFASHAAGMALLYAFHQGLDDPLDLALSDDLINYPGNAAEQWLAEFPGTCFYSGVSHKGSLVVHKLSSLNAIERRTFKGFAIIEIADESIMKGRYDEPCY